MIQSDMRNPASSEERETPHHRLLTVCGHSDVGRQRSQNQDTFVIADLASGEVSRPCASTDISVSRPGMLALVCDGMGGRPAGDVAARVAASTIVERLEDAGEDVVAQPASALTSAVEGANRAILDEVATHPEEEGMGTTCTAAVFGPDQLAVAQVGDSRAYLLRGGQLELLTRDQTLAAQMLDAGILPPDKLADFPYKHVLSQALGTNGPIKPVITAFPLEDGDRVLLCSDGLHGPVSDDAISEILNASDDPAEAARALVAAALAAGGPDNVTVVVADCGRLEATPGGR
jgi:serine/threonine protein phosphatase PrpC